MKNICLVLQYLGTNYCGFQRQKNGLSVQEVLENAILETFNQKCTVYPSGRTDAGVHAMGQVVNFFVNTTIAPEKIAIVLNLKLPKDIRVVSSCEVDLDFHSRKSAKSKTYIYKIYNGKQLSVFDQDRCLFCGYQLDLQKMNESAKYLIGTHDFSSFVASNTSTKTTTRTIFEAFFTKDENNYITFTITGSGFLYNMVRIIVGTLLEVGRGKKPVNIMQTLLEGNKRNMAGKTVKPDGLYLKQVNY